MDAVGILNCISYSPRSEFRIVSAHRAGIDMEGGSRFLV
jgi:hypothetical protein